ncbi:MAG: hypothetical protein KGH86_02545 [Thaumarchaeota archaeon]|nr:hypothetical protein [Nitrososphaerota archaeon]MDE1817376.1 hypothetical protein [Nitrososphaerota archaeon]MDE1875696.1 hypothetical protein [Nitrososphaerota archaeon]
MGTHNNIHVPKESWPSFMWYAIEFFVVLGAGLGISLNSMGFFTKMGFDSSMTVWAFWGIIGVVFLAYYLIVRPLILRRPILSKI